MRRRAKNIFCMSCDGDITVLERPPYSQHYDSYFCNIECFEQQKKKDKRQKDGEDA